VPRELSRPPIPAPVVLGADIGTYALARAFHEAFGVRPIVVAGAALGPVAHSTILDLELVDDGHDEEQIVTRLLEIAERRPGTRSLVVANSDWLVRTLVRHRDRLEPAYVIPFASRDVVAQVSDKAAFADLCASAGIPTPRTVHIRPKKGLQHKPPRLAQLEFPVVAKPASSAEYQQVSFPGKKKVFVLSTREECDALWEALCAADYSGDFLVQEYIPGDDAQKRSITAYVDSHGEVTLQVSAHVLLEEHTPSGLGNPAAMYTYRDDALLDAAVAFFDQVEYRGFANFDVKVDPRDGTAYFMEVNPRIGRNCHYVTAAGVNPMAWLVNDVIHAEKAPVTRVETSVLYSVVPTGLLMRYLDDSRLTAQVRSIIRATGVARPFVYRAERNIRRWVFVLLAYVNQWRKYARHYPVHAWRAIRRHS